MAAENVIQLRQLLANRFPNLQPFSTTDNSCSESSPCCVTGLPQIDESLAGGLPKGAITELVSGTATTGSAFIIQKILSHAQRSKEWVALVDGQDSFDPSVFEEVILAQLLWVRCWNAQEALKAADLLLRDGNLSLVLLDLRLNPASELRKIPATTWYRFQRILKQGATSLLVITPQTIVNNADARFSLLSTFTLEALTQTEEELVSQLKVRLAPKRGFLEEKSSPEELITRAG